MITKKERRQLTEKLNTLLMLYVADKESRRFMAKGIAEALNLDFVDHFVEACLAE